MTKTVGFAALTLALSSGAALAQAPSPQAGAGQIAALDLDKDGSISRDEWTKGGLPADLFGRADADGSGGVSGPEIRAALGGARRGGPGGGRFAANIAAADLDKDGSVSHDEWTKANLPPNLFAIADADKNGAISQAEVAAALASRRGPGGGRPGPSVAALDTDKSGGVSRDEWIKGGLPEARFAAADADKNGEVSETEVAAVLAAGPRRGEGQRGGRRGGFGGGFGGGSGQDGSGQGGFGQSGDE